MAYAGLIKLLEPIENFEAVLRDYQLLSLHMVPVIARIVPWIEWLAGSCLVAGFLPRQSAGICAALAFGFAFFSGFSILSGHGGKPCGCFGDGGMQLTTNQMFMLDLVLFFTSLRLFTMKSFPFSLEHWLNKKH